MSDVKRAYLIRIADELMTAPTEQLEVMYSETLRRIKTQPDAEIYPKIIKLLEQVAEKRFIILKVVK